MADLQTVSDADFDAQVLQADLPTLVDFWAEWCGPCKMMAPLLEQLAQELSGRLNVVKLDVQENQATAMRLGVMNLPTLILFKGGEEKERLAGYMPAPKILQAIEAYL